MEVLYFFVTEKYIKVFDVYDENTEILTFEVYDNYELTKIVATPKEKLDLLNLYKSLIGMYQTNTFIDIYNDYENTLRENKELKLR